jgi:phosphoribosylcarboxyaminoimidazole (NCAIR) mutase
MKHELQVAVLMGSESDREAMEASLQELEKLGIDDAQANPESASVAYHAATRQARLSVQ